MRSSILVENKNHFHPTSRCLNWVLQLQFKVFGQARDDWLSSVPPEFLREAEKPLYALPTRFQSRDASTRKPPPSRQPTPTLSIPQLHLQQSHITTIGIRPIQRSNNMSSPGHRRQRSSKSATPRRSSQRNAIPSSPPDPSAAQLHSEAAGPPSSSNGTPRRSSNHPSSSPMDYRSSPADPSRTTRDVSSPLRQTTQTTQDGDRTPRASGLIGGEFSSRGERFFMTWC